LLGFFLCPPLPSDADPPLVLSGGADGIGHANGRLRVKSREGQALLDEAYALNSQGEALKQILDGVLKFAGARPAAVGNRIVHGGPRLREHQAITPALVKTLREAVHFAPLHIPPAVRLIEETARLLPGVRQYACFDTAFHRTMPETSRRFALPERFHSLGVERFGFHGLSYESIVERLGDSLPERVVCAHLGSGASLVALDRGRSIDTSMGMTPTGGILMATRSGDLDPGILLFLLRTERLSADQVENLLNLESGLAALSGGESDMRLLEKAAADGDVRGKLAIESFAFAARKFIGAYAAELGGLDLLVFTGGIGEHSASMRNRICRGLDFLGVTGGDPAECTKVRVMESEEELQIARITWRLHR
jgi:acetate kinase